MIDETQMLRTCKHCRHWKKLPPDPNQIGGPKQGECQEHLTAQLLPLANGQLQKLSFYPQTPESFPACGRFAAKPIEVL